MEKEMLNVTYLNGATSIGRRSSPGDSPSTQPGFTGHADVEGLKAIGWDDDDIAYYQEHGVDWNEEDDKYHKVPDYNIELYGILTVDNIKDYDKLIVYLPKLDLSGITSLDDVFSSLERLVYIPYLDTSQVTSMRYAFAYNYSLVGFPPMDVSKVRNASYMFYNCFSLKEIPSFNFNYSILENVEYMFYNCLNVRTANWAVGASSSGNFLDYMYQLRDINGTVHGPYVKTTTFSTCVSLVNVKLNYFSKDMSLPSPGLSKDSILYAINNESIYDAREHTIQLHKIVYDKYANDPDVIEALSNHPYVLLSC